MKSVVPGVALLAVVLMSGPGRDGPPAAPDDGVVPGAHEAAEITRPR